MENQEVSKREEGQSHLTYSGQSPGKEKPSQSSPIISELPLEQIQTDPALQSRASMNVETVETYAELLIEGHEFPPVTVFQIDDTYLLADGFHRFMAHQQADKKTIRCEVRQGDRRKAILFSLHANASHGLHRTNDDKRKAVGTVLADPEWKYWSNVQIAKLCGVSDRFVSDMKAKLLSPNRSEIPQLTKTIRKGKTLEMDTSKIGRKKHSSMVESPLRDLVVRLSDYEADIEISIDDLSKFVYKNKPFTQVEVDALLQKIIEDANQLAELARKNISSI